MCDDDDKCGCGCYLILVGAVLTFIFMTVASPGFLLYGFFSTEWLTEDIDYLPTIATDRTWYSGDGGGDDDYNDDYYGRYRTTTTTRTDPNNKVHYGLFWKCYQGDCEEESEYII